MSSRQKMKVCYLCLGALTRIDPSKDLPVCQPCTKALHGMSVADRMDIATKVVHSWNMRDLSDNLASVLEFAQEIGPRAYDPIGNN